MPLRLLAVMYTCVLGAAASAHATPGVELDRPCYVEGQRMTVTGDGYAPGGRLAVMFEWGGRYGSDWGSLETAADSSGGLLEELRAPGLASDRDVYEDGSVVAAELGPEGRPTGNESAPAAFRLSAFGVWIPPWDARRVDPRKRTTFSVYGFQVAGPVVYAHYLRGRRHIRTVRLGATRGPCGNLRVRMRQFPFSPVPSGTYTVVFDAGRRHPNPTPGVVWRSLRVSRSKAVH